MENRNMFLSCEKKRIWQFLFDTQMIFMLLSYVINQYNVHQIVTFSI